MALMVDERIEKNKNKEILKKEPRLDYSWPKFLT